jgi:ABC-type transport system substrate-binding protein
VAQLARLRRRGSGPYVLKPYSTTSQITLAPNPRTGRAKSRVRDGRRPEHDRRDAADQHPARLARGRDRPLVDQAQTLQRNKNLKLSLPPSTWVFWLFANNNPQISSSPRTSSFQTAVRYALDYKSIVGVAGPGAIQAPGSSRRCSSARCREGRDQAGRRQAKAALAASGVGTRRSRSSTRAT